MPLILDPSKLNYRITFNEKKTVKINGVSVTENTPVGTVWAAVFNQKLSDRMANIGDEVTNTITFVIREKQSFEINNAMTVNWNGSTYEIKDISPDVVNKEWKTIICEVITG
ncbi:phage head closure protein [Pullulanibacillus sp. KACC 23026]|uniref:phage head closure protein n=1 Tax=Pullulanibacillus sp. KACC 23026 TaxID=3028315 RepID=UPI0023B0F017|nr:phage head closure protein [Pullulanibacillus sp. KACC 23026]WEG14152.1 phage head closure protein [Pullulanibacillus sp. KACC 23026]